MKKILIPVLFFIFFGSLTLRAGWLLEPEGETAAPVSTSTPAATTVQPKSNIAAVVPAVQPSVKYEVALINLKKSEGGSVTVSWQNPVSIQGYSLKVYRDTAVLDTSDKIVDSKMIAKLDPPAVSYIDKPASAGKYFYAVTVTYQGTEYKGLTPDVSYTSFGVNVAPAVVAVVPVTPPPVTGLTSSLQNSNTIELMWNFSTDTNVSYDVYRANAPIKTIDDLVTKLKRVKGKFTENPVPGNYYYAVTAENSAGENRKILLGTNSLLTAVVIVPKPVEVVKTPEPVKILEPVKVQPTLTMKTQIRVIIPSMREVKSKLEALEIVETKPYDDILLDVKRSSYYEEHYQDALVTLKGLANDEDCPSDVKNEAELFIGKCYYQLGRYSDAIKSLIKVKKFFPEEADFWISRSADKL